MVIGVDIDEVLSHTVDVVLKHRNYVLDGMKVDKSSITSYHIWDIEGVTYNVEESLDWFHGCYRDGTILKSRPVEGAYEKLIELKEKGYQLNAITARQDEFRDITHEWLKNHFDGIFSDVIFCNNGMENYKPKHVVCEELGVTHFIEDNIHYCLDIANKGIKTFLIDNPWNNWQNIKHDNIHRVKGWKEINI